MEKLFYKRKKDTVTISAISPNRVWTIRAFDDFLLNEIGEGIGVCGGEGWCSLHMWVKIKPLLKEFNKILADNNKSLQKFNST
jgi:hypothetical protein